MSYTPPWYYFGAAIIFGVIIVGMMCSLVYTTFVDESTETLLRISGIELKIIAVLVPIATIMLGAWLVPLVVAMATKG